MNIRDWKLDYHKINKKFYEYEGFLYDDIKYWKNCYKWHVVITNFSLKCYAKNNVIKHQRSLNSFRCRRAMGL